VPEIAARRGSGISASSTMGTMYNARRRDAATDLLIAFPIRERVRERDGEGEAHARMTRLDRMADSPFEGSRRLLHRAARAFSLFLAPDLPRLRRGLPAA